MKKEEILKNEEKQGWKRKPLTQEEINSINSTIEFLKDHVSDDFVTVMGAVANWNNDDESVRKANKEALVEAVPNLKDYIKSDKFAAEFDKIKGMTKLVTGLNLISSYYGRVLESKRFTKVKYNINGKIYSINKDWLDTIDKTLPKEERIALILAHPNTKCETIDIEEIF